MTFDLWGRDYQKMHLGDSDYPSARNGPWGFFGSWDMLEQGKRLMKNMKNVKNMETKNKQHKQNTMSVL